VGLLACVFGGCVVVNHIDGVAQAEELQKTGLPAQATILQIWDTGTTVNDDPVVGFLLDVRPQEGEPFQARTKQLISRLTIPQVQPGAVVGVRYDPKNPQRVSLDPATLNQVFTPPPLPPPLPAAQVAAEKQRILSTGVPGEATILQCVPLGLFDADGRPVYDLVVRVEVPGHPPLQGPTRVGVPKNHEEWFHNGQVLPIKADAADPTRFAVDWDRFLPPSPQP
jgi:hypothetical protein